MSYMGHLQEIKDRLKDQSLAQHFTIYTFSGTTCFCDHRSLKRGGSGPEIER